jgi:dCMP deaminase
VVSTGYNGFPKGISDSVDRLKNRDVKYRLIVHAESNAILNAVAPIVGCTLYVTCPPCGECAKLIIQAGITEVVTPFPTEDYRSRWEAHIQLSNAMFAEAGVVWTLHD